MKNTKKELGGAIENRKENYPPTGEWSQEKPNINDKCIACGQCVKFCPEGAITIKDNKAVVNLEYCKGCGLCAENCPIKAIEMKND